MPSELQDVLFMSFNISLVSMNSTLVSEMLKLMLDVPDGAREPGIKDNEADKEKKISL